MQRDTRLLVDLLRDRQLTDKNLGQHYLIDDNILQSTIELAGELSGKHVLEIGCGPGTLTHHLLANEARVTTIEIDQGSIQHMELQFDHELESGSLNIIEGDALTVEWPDDIDAIVANIPYQISSPLLERIQREKNELPIIVLLVQEEFANRMSMRAGPMDRGPLGLSLWLDFDVELGKRVPPSCFVPQPRVHSRLVRLNHHNRLQSMNSEVDRRLFRQVVSMCFEDRRRKLRNLLKRTPHRLNRIQGWHRDRWNIAIETISSHPHMDSRPEILKPEDWLALCQSISEN
ncbi:MAG: 16S rRNA (adenine(1518)-N(6)/adenine(1519)-N(6))-dimethyltransferase RsmA [Candidatus Thermoplasmatota archaeon]|nr:16S rRNA (adenine(1518)-N(6)/adenine(1519)-N(6))-dimethyltransferase RsmA [Candidatus Thermoplasmatota archaeon]